jgi:hypothetical protein
MATNRPTQSAKNVLFHQPKSLFNPPNPRDVRQDKVRNKSVRLPMRQPVTVTKVTRTPQSHTETTRSQNRSNPRQQRVLVGLWVKPRVREELLRRAETEGISLSAVGSAFLEEALQHSLSARYAPLLEPVIENAIRKQIRAMSTRMAWLLVRVAFDTGQTKTLVTNLLVHNQETFSGIARWGSYWHPNCSQTRRANASADSSPLASTALRFP